MNRLPRKRKNATKEWILPGTLPQKRMSLIRKKGKPGIALFQA
jgi:hypothetical protein